MVTSLSIKDYIIISGFSLVLIIGVFGNILVCYIFKKRYKRLTSMETLIYYLSLVDFLSSVTSPLLYIYWQYTHYITWHFHLWGCKLATAGSAVLLTMSFMMILLITLDRSRAICQPFHPPFNRKQMRFAVCVSLGISLLCEIPYFMDTSLMPYVKVTINCNNIELTTPSVSPIYNISFIGYTSCDDVARSNFTLKQFDVDKRFEALALDFSIINKSRDLGKCTRHCMLISQACNPKQVSSNVYSRIVLLLIRNVLFVIVFVVANWLIHNELYEKERQKALANVYAINPRKVLTILITMATTFIILVFPRDIFYTVYTISWLSPPGISYTAFARDLNSFLKLLQTSNSVCNVFIYARLHSRFKREIRKLSESIRKKSLDISFRTNSKSSANERITRQQFLTLKETIL